MSFIVDFLKAVAGICKTKPIDPTFWRVDGKHVTVKVATVQELQSPFAAVYLTGNGLETPVLIVRDEESNFHCFSNRCTHFGRKLDPVPGQPTLRCCSVNHATFDYQGNKLSGPAKAPLRVYPCKLENGDLVISIQDGPLDA